MFTKRIVLAIIGGLVLTATLAAPASAAKPTVPPTSPPIERQLTAEERAAANRKVADSDAYLASVAEQGGDLASLSCVSPTGTSTQAEIPPGCYAPQAYLSVAARDQTKSYYCGPATGQVISNYSWAVAASADKYTQAMIAGWMKTELNRGTSAPELEAGLELGTQGSPRRAAGWNWVVLDVFDRDRDGHTGDELHGYVRSNVSNAKMPLAIPVKPHDPKSHYYLVSWPRAVVSVGHWIAAYGWYGHFTGTTFARIYYTDSSRDEGGSTGKFWDPTRDIAALIQEHTKRLVW